MTKKKQTTKRPVVKVPDPSYQPSRAQLRQDQRIKGATFDQAVGAFSIDPSARTMDP